MKETVASGGTEIGANSDSGGIEIGGGEELK
jgi:hypothetical protein